MAPDRLHHLAIKAKDVDRVAAFYRNVLGLREMRRFGDTKGLRSIWLAIGDGVLMVERADTEGPEAIFDRDPPGLHLVAFGIQASSRPVWRQRLQSLGHPILRESPFTLYVQDPEGNRVGLSSWPDPEVDTEPANP